MEDDRAPVMQRNAAIALADLDTAEAMDVLRQYKDTGTGKLDEYVAWLDIRESAIRPCGRGRRQWPSPTITSRTSFANV